MGYSNVTKGYILYDMSKHVFFTNMDVTFRENVFPFQLQSSETSQTVDPFFTYDAYSVPTTTVTPCSPALNLDSSTTVDYAAGNDSHNTSTPENAPENEILQDISTSHGHESSDTDVPTEETLSIPSCADTNVPLRRSQRGPKEPVWMIDYVTNKPSASSVMYPIEESVTYDRLLSSYQLYLGAFSAIIEPKNFQHASQDQRWVDAM